MDTVCSKRYGTSDHTVQSTCRIWLIELQGERLAALQHVLTGWMEEVMAGMAGYVPLQAIGQRILGQYSQQQFGDFRGSLLGLLSAYNYESSMLTTARCSHHSALPCLRHNSPVARTIKVSQPLLHMLCVVLRHGM